MANTDITQRSQYERSDLLAKGEGIRRGSEKGAAIYSGIALVVGVLLSYVAVKAIDNWSQWLVLGVIILTMIGFMIALSPNRRGA
jgi:UDP-N-acetylmuramyl pentapeptide phosphotransferase/UDP-N-acetylglucosamine-1-phosphate transferase